MGVAELKWEWRRPRAPTGVAEGEDPGRPALSMANIRRLLVAVLPLRQLTPAQALAQVASCLDARTRAGQPAPPEAHHASVPPMSAAPSRQVPTRAPGPGRARLRRGAAPALPPEAEISRGAHSGALCVAD